MIDILKEILPYFIGLVVSIAGWFTAKNLGRREGERDTLMRDYNERTQALKEHKKAHDKVRNMDDATLREYATKWLRDSDK